LIFLAACGNGSTPASTGPGLIAFESSRTGGNTDIYVMDEDGTGITRVAGTEQSDQAPVWSYDGSQIAFVSNRNGSWDIFVVGADGSGETALTSDAGDEEGPAWSPDGSKIAFSTDRDGQFEIYVMNADGSEPTNITNDPEDDFSPAWSPDGSTIAFSSYRDGDGEIYMMNADGSGVTQMTDNQADDSDPKWSPDGTRIAFVSDRDAPPPEETEPGTIVLTFVCDVFVMSADGTDQERLLAEQGSAAPSWSPDGTRIAYGVGCIATSGIAVAPVGGGGSTVLVRSAAGTADGEPDWHAG